MRTATYSYAYNDIGNRKHARPNVVAHTCSANPANQYVCVTSAGVNNPQGTLIRVQASGASNL